MPRIDRLSFNDDRGFRIHAAVFTAVMTLLVLLNLADREVMWVQWPLLGWGAGLALHASAVSARIRRVRVKAEQMRDRRIASTSPSI
ncbi:MAG: 2TM domain-containing protein [Hyphomicrobiaceae bacterium]|nr:2TM domain-containing protein [Hyphomicrobiaceae bacterium]